MPKMCQRQRRGAGKVRRTLLLTNVLLGNDVLDRSREVAGFPEAVFDPGRPQDSLTYAEPVL